MTFGKKNCLANIKCIAKNGFENVLQLANVLLTSEKNSFVTIECIMNMGFCKKLALDNKSSV